MQNKPPELTEPQHMDGPAEHKAPVCPGCGQPHDHATTEYDVCIDGRERAWHWPCAQAALAAVGR